MKKHMLIAVCIVAVIAVVAAFAYFIPGSNGEQTGQQTAQNTETAQNAETAQQESAPQQESTQAPQTEQQNQTADGQNTQTAEPEEEKTYSPTFMYFVTDAQEKETSEMISSLKSKYPDVIFDIKNVDKDPSLLENFQLVSGKTPALIMLNTSNDICAIEFTCTDSAKLEEQIKLALGK